MQPILEYLPRASDESFVVRDFKYPYFPTPWHFHPEYELVFVVKSTGKKYIGMHISDFMQGDLMLIGPYLPHTYKNDVEFINGTDQSGAHSIVVHFKEDSLGSNFLALPETRNVVELLKRSTSGLQIIGKTRQYVTEKMFLLTQTSGLERWMILVDILKTISESSDAQQLPQNNLPGRETMDESRMNDIIDYVLKNFQHDISIQNVSDIANLSENSFSRYFKKRTRRLFSSFLTEVRLSHALKLITETNMPILEVCYQSGFNNLSNFNRQFLKQYHMSPLQYRIQFIDK